MTFGSLIVAAALVVASATPWSVPDVQAQGREESQRAALRDLQAIEHARRMLADTTAGRRGPGPHVDADDARRAAALVSVMPVFGTYTQLLTTIAWARDPAALEAEYQAWARARQLEVVQALSAFARFAADQKVPVRPMDADIIRAFAAVVTDLQRAADGLDGRLAEPDLPRLKAAVWKLKFVETPAGTKERTASLEAKARALEAQVAHVRELEAITTGLGQTIAAGVTDARLEQRIAALPPDARAAVEALRAQKQEARARELARAREEQQDREQRLTRQRAIDNAIRLRREELETGKPNPIAEAQRRQDAELRRAVGDWEAEYRRAQAEKKVEESRHQRRPGEPVPSRERGEIAAAAQACTQPAVEESTLYSQIFPDLKKDSFNAAYFRCMYEKVSDPGLNEEYRLLMIIANNQLRGIDRQEWCRDFLAEADRGTPQPGVTSRAALRCLAGE